MTSGKRLARAWNGVPGHVLRLLLLAVPVVWIARNVDLGAVWRGARSVSLATLALASGLLMLGTLIGALRWRTLLVAYDAKRSQPGSAPAPDELPALLTLYRHCLVAFYYAVLPSGLAGEVLRGYRVRACLPSTLTSYTVVLVERVSGFVGLLLIALVAKLLGRGAGEATVDSAVVLALDIGVAGATAFALATLVLPYLLRHRRSWRERVSRLPLVGPLLLRVPAARSLRGVLPAVPLSMITQLGPLGGALLFLSAVAPEVSPLAAARVIPFVVLLTYIPLTPAAVGQREMISVYFFGLIGVSAPQAIVVSLLSFAASLSISAVGALLHLAERLGWIALDAAAAPPDPTADDGK